MNALAYQATETVNHEVTDVDVKHIQELMLQLGFPQHVYGYNYIAYALVLIMHDPEVLHHITKELYPDIAKHFRSTPSRVERAIRTSIHITWLYGNINMIEKVFGYSIIPDKGFPTNTQLLAGLYFYLTDRKII
ncbi:MAG: sporulation initiation factor Spo0A C-terminal domain-containing protein [Roseburia sp.]|nr:sporulation initiation factor Spo0A C-terminal domain-containing protein [Roseburia sp.]MBQ8279534.1 sporulation initiation factor Spo0A C-terminal domain-containing protein [Roseburia sp.]